MSSPKKGVCTVHIELQIDFICCECNNLLCMECYRNHSQSHRLVKLEEYFQDQKPHLLRELRKVQTLRRKLNGLRSRLQKCHEQREAVQRDCMNSIESFDKVQHHIDRWKLEVLEDLKKMKRKELQSTSISDEPGMFKKPVILCRKADIAGKVRKLTPIFIADDLASVDEYQYIYDSGIDPLGSQQGRLPLPLPSQPPKSSSLRPQMPPPQPKRGTEECWRSQSSGTDQLLLEDEVYESIEDEDYFEDPSIIAKSQSGRMLHPQSVVPEKVKYSGLRSTNSIGNVSDTGSQHTPPLLPVLPSRSPQPPPQQPVLPSQPQPSPIPPVPLPRCKNLKSMIEAMDSEDKLQLQGVHEDLPVNEESQTNQMLDSQPPLPLPRRSGVSKTSNSSNSSGESQTSQVLYPQTAIPKKGEVVNLKSCEAYSTESIGNVSNSGQHAGTRIKHTYKNINPLVSQQAGTFQYDHLPEEVYKGTDDTNAEEDIYDDTSVVSELDVYAPPTTDTFQRSQMQVQPTVDRMAEETAESSRLELNSSDVDQHIYEEIPFEEVDPALNLFRISPPSPKGVILEPCNSVVNGVFARSEGEEVHFNDVCTNKSGCIILSDYLNTCLRVLEGTDKGTSRRITIPLNGSPIALAFSRAHGNKFKNGAVLVAGNFHDCYLKKVKLTEAFTCKIKNLKSKAAPIALACGDCDRSRNTSDCSFALMTDRNHASIHCLNCNGEFNGTLGTDEIGQNPFGMDYYNDYLVLCDRKAGCLVKISSKGQRLWPESVEARRRGVLKKPHGVAILPMEYIAVSDTETHSISIFSKDGALKMVFGRKGKGSGEFFNPTALAICLSQELVVLDSDNHRIQMYRLNHILNGLDT